MEVYVVEIDKNDNDEWILFGIFSSKKIAKSKLEKNNIKPNCSSITPIRLDEATRI